MAKYELTNETLEMKGQTLYRIRALRDVGTFVKAGDLGGFVGSKNNLSQDKGSAWIYDDAQVKE